MGSIKNTAKKLKDEFMDATGPQKAGIIAVGTVAGIILHPLVIGGAIVATAAAGVTTGGVSAYNKATGKDQGPQQ
jgi:hypothetical protein